LREGISFLLVSNFIIKNIIVSAAVGAVACFTVLTLLAGIIGSAVDGVTWSYVRSIDICGDTNTGTVYGNTDSTFDLVSACSSVTTQYTCFCASTATSTCIVYDLADDSKYNCGDVIGYWSNMLGASTVFCAVIAFGGLVYSILMCSAACSNGGCCGRPQQQSQTPQNSIKSNIAMQPVPTTDVEAVHVQVVAPATHPVEMKY
jgi:hypothetical protein